MHKKTIFIVEDDPDISELIQMILKNEGYAVKAFPEIDKIESFIKKEKPNLVIMDLFIGGSDSGSLVKKLKKKKEFDHIPMILVSAKNSLEEIAKESRADGFLPKPFNVKDLVSLVKKFV